MPLIVEVTQGKLEGKVNTSILTGKPYFSFHGIPYAKPPLGQLRFQAPEPYAKWEGIYDATYEKKSCIQHDYFKSQGFLGSEDCLYLNVNTPQMPNDTKVPKAVMVFIHGGGFFIGSGSDRLYSSDYLIENDVIVVTLNYRLHVFGFLNLGTPGCPGNAGLKDQLLALKWVRENISNFGGDPENITIFGESAGATSVHFHTISPLSKGLFKKAIIQSGSAYCPRALTLNPYEIGFELGEKLGFMGKDREELLHYLKHLDAGKLVAKVVELQKELNKRNPCRFTNCAFAPSVEAIKDGAFLPDLPEKLMETANPLPIIFGANEKDATLIFSTFEDNFMELISHDLSIVLKNNFKMDSNKLTDIVKKIKHHYFGDKEIGTETVDKVIDLFTDIYYYRSYESVDFVVNSSFPVYIYEFAYDGSFKLLTNSAMKKSHFEIKGAAHGDELRYLFHSKLLSQVPPKGDELKVINNITTLWTNFAKFGYPSNGFTWKPFTPKEPSFLLINLDSKLMEGKIYGNRTQFLKDLLNPVAKPLNEF